MLACLQSAHCSHPEAAWVGASSRKLCCIPAAYKLLTQANKFTTEFKIDTEVYIQYGLRPLVSQVPFQALTVEDDPWSYKVEKKSALCKSRSDYYPINIQQGTFSAQVRPIHVRSQGQCRSRKWGSARTQKVCCDFCKRISFDRLSLFQILVQCKRKTK